MQWSLFVLILMGQCSFSLCHLYEYHFVKETKTWKEAQTYCREHYTDLAKVSDMTDMKRLNDSASNQGEAWIGLRNKNNVNRKWLWSLPGVEFIDSETEWEVGQPDDNNAYPRSPPDNCVMMKNHKWSDHQCSQSHPFICYDETNPKTFHLINGPKTWLEAQSYCREHHTDLVSGPTQLNDEEFKTEIMSQSHKYVWIGLFRDTWRWSDESSFSFRFWDPVLFKDEDDKKCAMTVSNGKWSFDGCSNTKPFFCYDDKVILIKENKTWEDALTYCRENHYELVSITNRHQQRWVEEVAKQANSPYVWTGLRYTCTLGFWFWITDEAVSYKNWEPQGKMDECGMSGAMETVGDHKWFKKNADEKFNFICIRD